MATVAATPHTLMPRARALVASDLTRLIVFFIVALSKSVLANSAAEQSLPAQRDSSPTASSPSEDVRPPLPATLRDRPWLLQPVDRNAYRLILIRALDADASLGIIPLNFEQGYTENLTVFWEPIPLHFRYRFLQFDQTSCFAELAFLGLSYARENDFNWRPFLSLQATLRISPILEVGIEWQDTLDVKRENGQSTFGNMMSWRLKDRVTPLPPLSIENWAELAWERGEVRARYPGALPPDLNNGKDRLRLLTGLSLVFLPHPVVELRGDLALYAVGYPAGYLSIPFYLTGSLYF